VELSLSAAPIAPKRGRTHQPNQAVADAVERAPATKAGTKGVVAVGEHAVKEDVAKALVRVMLRQPDPLVADVQEYAVWRQSSSGGRARVLPRPAYQQSAARQYRQQAISRHSWLAA
jgi:hypothetical protein